MRKTISILSLMLALIISDAACARGRGMALLEPDADPTVAQSATQAQSFVQVEGADLPSKLEAAARQARARAPQTPYWSAYGFDVRPGVAVDPGGGEFHGSMDTVGGLTVFVGTRNGMTVETRNLGVFVLRQPGSNAVTRLEVYNLDRKREYGGYAVYWLGRAGSEESLNYLRSIADAGQQRSLLPERTTLAVALHDDMRVGGILKEFVRSSRVMKVRSTAVYWLGQAGGETAFLADLVRNEREPTELRRHAAHAIGAGRDPEALNVLRGLYASVTQPREVRRGIIHAVAENDDRDAAYAFLLKVAQTDPDRESRKVAVHQFGEIGGDRAVEELMKIYAGDQDMEVRRQVLHALSEIESPRAEARLLEIARGGDHVELRRQAIHWIGEREGEAAVDELMRIYASEQNVEIKRQILHAFSEMQSPRAAAKLLSVARDPQEQREARRQAIHWIGEREGDTDATVNELMRIFDGERDREVRQQILHALSEMENPRAEDKLFEVARRKDDTELRKQAIHWLGEKASQRSFEMLRDTVNDSGEDAEVQMQALHAISEKPAEQSVPLLIKVARTHPNPQLRRSAIHWLGESGDPRAVEFFKEVLSKQ